MKLNWAFSIESSWPNTHIVVDNFNLIVSRVLPLICMLTLDLDVSNIEARLIYPVSMVCLLWISRLITSSTSMPLDSCICFFHLWFVAVSYVVCPCALTMSHYSPYDVDAWQQLSASWPGLMARVSDFHGFTVMTPEMNPTNLAHHFGLYCLFISLNIWDVQAPIQ